MVDRVEYDYTSDWFLIHFLNRTRPIGSGENNQLNDLELSSIRSKSDTLAGYIFTNLDKGFDEIKNITAYNNFGDSPENLMNKFNEDLHKNIKGSTKGPALGRIAPFLLLNKDSLNIIFEFTLNGCLIDDRLIDQKIPPGCILLIIDYDNKSKYLLENVPYENKNEKYIIIDGNKFADDLGIDVQFLKERAIYTIVPTSSVIISKIRQNPIFLIDCDDTTKKWLYKATTPQNYILSRGKVVNIN